LTLFIVLSETLQLSVYFIIKVRKDNVNPGIVEDELKTGSKNNKKVQQKSIILILYLSLYL